MCKYSEKNIGLYIVLFYFHLIFRFIYQLFRFLKVLFVVLVNKNTGQNYLFNLVSKQHYINIELTNGLFNIVIALLHIHINFKSNAYEKLYL